MFIHLKDTSVTTSTAKIFIGFLRKTNAGGAGGGGRSINPNARKKTARSKRIQPQNLGGTQKMGITEGGGQGARVKLFRQEFLLHAPGAPERYTR